MTGKKEFEGRVAIISGAARGIGEATARRFANAGASLVLTDVLPQVEELAAELRDTGSTAVSCVSDISTAAGCATVVDYAEASFGRLDFAFNNAGISGERKVFAEVSEDEWDTMIAVNLSAVFHSIRLQIPMMLKNGGGVIVNTSSIVGARALKGFAPYMAAKHGVKGLTYAAAVDYASEGIRSLAIGPGLIDTPMTQQEGTEDFRTEVSAFIPQGRVGTAEEVAGLVKFLCSDEASYMNGAYITVDGALTT